MPRPLFERYKDALRRGHAAFVAGRLEKAIEAYSTAARIVPDRALPYTSTAAALVQLGRRDEALLALDQAVALAADDESALRARAAILHELGRDPDAAADLERLASILAAGGRRDEALRHARRSLELAPTDGRRGLVADLEPAGASTEWPVADGSATSGATGTAVRPAWPAIDLPSPPPEPRGGPARDPEQLVATATDRIAAGDIDAAREQLLEAVAVHRAAGRPDAALDVCFRLLEIAPGDPAVHLAIANVQLDRGWQDFAADKLRLLLQLTALTGDTQAAADAHALAAERLRDDDAAAVVASG
jgi:tetratricopeptide (TPR) repeat protein